jgi:hypothetical protein
LPGACFLFHKRIFCPSGVTSLAGVDVQIAQPQFAN